MTVFTIIFTVIPHPFSYITAVFVDEQDDNAARYRRSPATLPSRYFFNRTSTMNSTTIATQAVAGKDDA
jgi:hypothetical protein